MSKPAADPLADLRQAEEHRYPDPAEGTTPDKSTPSQVADALTEAVRAAVIAHADPDGIAAEERPVDLAIVQEFADVATEAARKFAAPPPDVQSVIERLHGDSVALGFLHGGGVCGCRYIVKVGIGG